ncbi:hypothetical protein GCM10017668_24380 [Streptomyces tuirus]|uniref:Uncharacterized protein n=1 Tax=Streptomyces tuirus TaxID=68278 RepID=A0A7G1NHP4_9ACTN|nr:hypothetical protein GCM10017668_24380 [Streptomyces tuirus]
MHLHQLGQRDATEAALGAENSQLVVDLHSLAMTHWAHGKNVVETQQFVKEQQQLRQMSEHQRHKEGVQP